MALLEIRKGGLTRPPFGSTGESSTTELIYENYVPIDYIRFELLDVEINDLLNNVNLNFTQCINPDTGEIIQRKSRTGEDRAPMRHARYKNLDLMYYPLSNRLIVSGSLHTLYNDGQHNHNGFDIKAFTESLDILNREFGITPDKMHILQLEWGVNITPPIETNTLIDHCLFHNWKRFEVRMEGRGGKYHQAEYDEYFIKLYNKGLQFELDIPTLRFERKQIKYSRFAYKHGIGQTLKDLIDSDFIGLRETLLNDWQCIILFDPQLTGVKRYLKMRDPMYWKGLKKGNTSRQNKSNKRKVLDQANEVHGGNVKNKVYEIIKLTLDQLSKDVVTISPFRYISKPSTPTTPIPRRCSLTGLDISMQREDSHLLSHAGLKWLIENDYDKFDKVVRMYITRKWIYSDMDTIVKEVAHNIRTKFNDRVKRERKKSLQDVGQYDMFTNHANNILAVHYGV